MAAGSWLRELVAELRALGVTQYDGPTLEPKPRTVGLTLGPAPSAPPQPIRPQAPEPEPDAEAMTFAAVGVRPLTVDEMKAQIERGESSG